MTTPGSCGRPKVRSRRATVNISAPDPAALARFYSRLLGWDIRAQEPNWVILRAPDGGVSLSFETDQEYVPPTWPSQPGRQVMMMHLEIRVDDLDSAVEHATSVGAVLADVQLQEDVRVCLDPAGHPFCLWLGSAEGLGQPARALLACRLRTPVSGVRPVPARPRRGLPSGEHQVPDQAEPAERGRAAA